MNQPIYFDWDYTSSILCHYAGDLPQIIEPPTPQTTCKDGNVLVKPRLLIWNPPSQIGHTLHCPRHPLVPLLPKKWMADKLSLPRKLYDKDGTVLLLTKQYECIPFSNSPLVNNKQRHLMLATDEGILTSHDFDELIPFILTHRAGCTRIFQQEVVQRVINGTSFQELESSLKKSITSQLESNLLEARSLCRELDTVTAEQIHKELGLQSASNSLLQSIFLLDYDKHKNCYEHSMSSLKSRSLAIDSIDKMTLNIGYRRKSDNVWANLYDGLYALVNENGQVVHFKFVNDMSFESVRDLLRDIKSHNDHIEVVTLDNCCEWEKKIHEVFGQSTRVVMDPFHALQCITKTISMSNPLRQSIIENLTQVFRQEGDDGIERKQETPTTTIICAKMEAFRRKWRNVVSINNIAALNSDSHAALDILTLHISKGCLSKIPAGVGTERNERLHSLLNISALSVPRIGPELATALLHTVFHRWNKLKTCHSNGNTCQEMLPKECDNICHKIQRSAAHIHECDEPFPTSTLASQPVGSTSDRDGPLIPLVLANAQAIHYCSHAISSVINFLRDRYGSSVVDRENVFLNYASPFSLLSNIDSTLYDVDIHLKALKLIPTVVCSNEAWSNFLFTRSADITTMKRTIQTFCTSEVRVIVCIAGTTSISTCFVVFIPEYVDAGSSVLCEPCFLSVTFADGWSLQLLSSDTTPSMSVIDTLDPLLKPCRCGVNPAPSGEATPCNGMNTTRYKSRCKCFRNNQECTSRCYCRGCANPFGAKSRYRGMQTRRPKLSTRRKNLKRTPSEAFLGDSHGDRSEGTWSDIDSIALYTAKTTLSIDNNRQSESTVCDTEIQSVYIATKDICVVKNCHVPITPHSVSQIEFKIRYFENKRKAFNDILIPAT